MTHTRLFTGLLIGLLTPGCAAFGDLLGGPNVEGVAVSVQKPANVAAYLEVTDGEDPVVTLETHHFKIYENEQALSADEIGQRLLSRDRVTDERVVLLLDLSGKPTPAMIDSLVKGVENFVEKVQSTLPVSVLAYDGTPGLRPVAHYARAGEGAPAPSASALRHLGQRDASRDLHGAVLKGIKELDVRLMAQKKPIRLGTLVVVALGPDLAGRASEQQIHEALEHKQYNVLGVGVGEETPYLDGFARAGVIHAQVADTLPIAFEEAAMRVLKTHGKYYLLSYCSPARAGARSLRIEVTYTNATGDEKVANFYHDFDAQGFGAGCKSDALPRFVVARAPNEAAPSAEATASPAPDPADATRSEETAPANGDVAPPPSTPDYQ